MTMPPQSNTAIDEVGAFGDIREIAGTKLTKGLHFQREVEFYAIASILKPYLRNSRRPSCQPAHVHESEIADLESVLLRDSRVHQSLEGSVQILWCAWQSAALRSRIPTVGRSSSFRCAARILSRASNHCARQRLATFRPQLSQPSNAPPQ